MMNKCIYHSLPMVMALSWYGSQYDFLTEAIIVMLISVAIGLIIDKTAHPSSKADSSND